MTIAGDHRHRHRQQRKVLFTPLSVFADNEALLLVFRTVIQRYAGIELIHQMPAQGFRPLGIGNNHKVVAPDVPDENTFPSGLFQLVRQDPCNLLDDLTGPSISILIGKRLKIVKINLAEGKGLSGRQALINDPFNGQVARQSGQRARIEIHRLQHFEAFRHPPEGAGQTADFITMMDLKVVVKLPFGNQTRRFFKFPEGDGNIIGDQQCQGQPGDKAHHRQNKGHS